jgi:hypothetical protein
MWISFKRTSFCVMLASRSTKQPKVTLAPRTSFVEGKVPKGVAEREGKEQKQG